MWKIDAEDYVGKFFSIAGHEDSFYIDLCFGLDSDRMSLININYDSGDDSLIIDHLHKIALGRIKEIDRGIYPNPGQSLIKILFEQGLKS